MRSLGERDRLGRVHVLLQPEEAQALLEHLDLPEEEPEEDDENRTLVAGEQDEFQVDKYSLRKRLERAARGEGAPQPALGNSPGTERAGQQFSRGW
jgi:hypothetical protein